MNKSVNHIPRNFTMICATCICETSAGKPSKWFIWRDYSGYHGINHNSGKIYSMFPSHIRDPHIYRIDAII